MKKKKVKDQKAIERVRRWRDLNREHYNAYMRDYLRRRRAEGKRG